MSAFLMHGCARVWENVDHKKTMEEVVSHCTGELKGEVIQQVEWDAFGSYVFKHGEYEQNYFSLPFGLNSILSHLFTGMAKTGEVWIWPEAGPKVSNSVVFESLYSPKDSGGKYQKIVGEENKMFFSCITPYEVSETDEQTAGDVDKIAVGPSVSSNCAEVCELQDEGRRFCFEPSTSLEELNKLSFILLVSSLVRKLLEKKIGLLYLTVLFSCRERS